MGGMGQWLMIDGGRETPLQRGRCQLYGIWFNLQQIERDVDLVEIAMMYTINSIVFFYLLYL